MIPVRDEVHLQTVIFTPKRSTGPLPFLMVRTPYGVPEDESGLTSGTSDDLIDDGYIFVFQNIRGRFKSEGQFVMQRPARDPRRRVLSTRNRYLRHHRVAVEEYSQQQWQSRNLGNLISGVAGDPGFDRASSGAEGGKRTGLADDMFVNDDFHHNGTFRLSYGFEYSALVETAKEENTNFAFDKYDTYEWYLGLGALSNADKKFPWKTSDLE